MADMVKAREVYEGLIDMFDARNWTYTRHDDDLVLSSGVKGDDLPIEFIVAVRAENQVVQLLSRLPFEIPENKRVDAACAICYVNNKILDGSFDYDLFEGKITFRLTSSYRDSELGSDLFGYMVDVSAATIDVYNDRLFMLAKGVVDFSGFVQMEENSN